MGKFDNLRKRMGVDEELERVGSWCVLESEPKVRARVLHAHHKAVVRAQHRVTMEAIESGAFVAKDAEESQATDVEIAAAMVSAWEGLLDDDGQPVRASSEVNADILRAMPEWREKIVRWSRNPKNIRQPSAVAVEIVGKPSSPRSAPAAT